MDKSDWPKFCKLIEVADETIGNSKRSQSAMGFMFRLVQYLPFSQVQQAVADHIRESVYPIKPADIIRLAGGNVSDRSAVGWTVFLNAIREYGSWESVRFPSPEYHYVIERKGGWYSYGYEIGMMDEGEIHFREKGFRELFEIGCRVASWGNEPGKVKVPAYCVGECERNNRFMGHLDFLPDVIEVSTGYALRREDLLGAGEPVAAALPEFALRGV